MGAFRAHATFWFDRRGAGRPRHSQSAHLDLDHHRASGGALGSYGIQSTGRCHYRCGQPTHSCTRASRRQAEQVVCHMVRCGHVGHPDLRRLSTQSAGLLPVARGIGDNLPVFLHQTIHALVTCGAWTRDGYGSGRRLDCGARLAGSPHPDSDGSSGLLGRRLRHPL